ncbi:MAG: hypothetical protein LBR79_05335 [Oscillospiraceae bacterium]|nr:hypothetical protein [Oscillospiraceae bacterium]
MYFLPAVGWEKVIKIRRFSSGTAINRPFRKLYRLQSKSGRVSKELKSLLSPPQNRWGGKDITNYSRYALKKSQFQKSFFPLSPRGKACRQLKDDLISGMALPAAPHVFKRTFFTFRPCKRIFFPF